MVVTNKVKVDLERLSAPSVIYAVQSDQYSRDVEFSLYSNGVEWNPEINSNIIASFEKPDGTGGQYNALPSGESAYSISGNKVVVAIAPQVLTVPGIVYFSVGLVSGNSTIYTFPIQINVQENPGISATSEDYFNISGFLSNSGWTPNMFLATDANGNVVAKVGSGGGGGTGDCVFTSLHLTDGILTMDASKNGYFSITSDDDIVVKLGNISIPTGKTRLLAYLYYNHNDASGVIPENTAFSATDIQTGVIYGGNTLGSASTTFPYIRTINGKTPDSSGDIAIEATGGNDGYSPVANVEQTDTGAVISITDKTGTTTATVTNGKDGAPGQDGSDYVLTDDDISEIAERAATLVPAGTSEVFIATYGETTYAEIAEAVNAGKICVCTGGTDKSWRILLTGFSTSVASFSGTNTSGPPTQLCAIHTYKVTSQDVWTTNQYSATDTITASNPNKLATADAVYGYAQPKGNYLTDAELSGAVNDALAQAKASGEFDGVDGKDGSNGKDGTSVTHSWSGTTLTVTSASGTSSANLKGDKGDKGDTGATGETGAVGYTPVKGIDYWTETDKAEIVSSVIEALGGNPIFGVVDDDNNIVVYGDLADGTYSVKYEMADGRTVDIGKLTLGEVVEIINQIPLSTDTDGTIYNGVGYKTGTRINSSGAAVAMAGYSCTGFIPAKTGETLYMYGMYFNDDSGNTRIAVYKEDKTLINSNIYPSNGGYVSEGNDIYSHTITDADAAFVRLGVAKIMDGSEIITINQPIE